MILPKQATLDALPAPYPDDPLPRIRALLAESGRKIFVLDDDPTGTQTVYDVPVLTEWSAETLVDDLRDPAPLAYILTNSRSLPLAEAEALNRELGENIRCASDHTARPVSVFSRSDSTLRGHFPGEVYALADGLGAQPDGCIVVPAFFEGGRYTLDDVHYVADGDSLIPAADTEYARDAYFGYTRSNLREWIAEKHGGTSPKAIHSISISDLRQRGAEHVAERLQMVSGGEFVIVNAADYRDLEGFALGVLLAETAGKRFITRTAASYVRAAGGLAARGLLTRADLLPDTIDGSGGLVIAGSYIQKSTAQIETARHLHNVASVEIHVERLLNPDARDTEVHHVIASIEAHLASGVDVVAYTSRELVSGETRERSLTIGQVVSAAVVEVVGGLRVRPAWMIAKGGITSSDVATKALNIRRAVVLGQLLPGVPVWRAGDESKWSGLTYVVFPGNVGDEGAIARAMSILRGEKA